MPRTSTAPVISVSLTTSVERRITQYLDIKSQIKLLNTQLDVLKERITDDLTTAGPEGIETDDFKASLITGTNTRIDPDLLLSLGVRPIIIRKATKETPYTYPKIVAKNGKAKVAKGR
jgi:predicted phage-related endonuclease